MLTADLDAQQITKHSVTRVIGIDEAGRGAWAGPVAVGYFAYELSDPVFPEIADSKRLNLKTRELLHDLVLDDMHGGVVFGQLDQINSVGIGLTITEIIAALVRQFDDGNTFFVIDGVFAADFGPKSAKIIKADDSFYSVAAASILAKVRRDRLMRELHHNFPVYGFDSHVGYGTKAHRTRISEHGMCELHRTSFKPLANLK